MKANERKMILRSIGIIALAICAIGFSKKAAAEFGNGRECQDYYTPDPDYPGQYIATSWGCYGCAPEVQASNLSNVDSVVKTTLAQSEFSDASTAKSKLGQVVGMPVGQTKINAYFALMGVTPKAGSNSIDADTMLRYIYARPSDSQYLSAHEALKKNLQISDAQSTQIENAIMDSVRPGN